MGRKLTLELPAETYESLQEQAERCGKSPEEVGAEWLSERVNRAGEGALMALAGAFESDVTDAGSRHDDYLGEALLTEKRGDGQSG